MTNPNNAVGTPAAFSGRTSVKAFNNITGAFTPGIINGWDCAPVSGLTVAVGGTAGIRDIAVAGDANGNRTTISNISEAPIEVAMGASPATYNRIDAIVAYVEPSPTGDNSTQDNPMACGIIPVAGTAAANPDQPTDAQIRAAITTDGGTGSSAYYCILALITRTPGQTEIAIGSIIPPTKSLTHSTIAATFQPATNTTVAVSTSAWTAIPLSQWSGDAMKIDADGKLTLPGGRVKLGGQATLWISGAASGTAQNITVRARLDGINMQVANGQLLITPGASGFRCSVSLGETVFTPPAGSKLVLEAQVYAGTASATTVRAVGAHITVQTI